MEFEYLRGGTLAYFAAYDVHHARVIGTIADKTGIEPFADLVAQVMTTEPYASAKRVFWVVDNGSSHNGQRSVDRMQEAWPTAIPTWPTSPPGSWPSRTATTLPQLPSGGSTPAPTSTTTSPGYDATTHSPPHPRTPPDPRRTYGDAH